MSVSFWTNAGSFDNLNVVTRCGCRPCASQMRWTVERLTPAALAIERQLQWVAPGGVSCKVECTMACTWSAVISGLRPRPGRTAPTESKPSVRNRARQSNTVGRLMPSAVAMRLLATPSPAISNALAWDTTRCGAVALRAHISSVLLSSASSGSGAAGWFMPTAYYSRRG